MTQLTPNMVQMIKDVLNKEVEPAVDRDISEDGKKSGKFKFTKLDFGSEKPKWKNIIVHKSKAEGRIITIDFDFEYMGDCDMEVEVLGFTSGVSTINMEGRARLVLSPMIKKMPLVGGMQFQFLNLPRIGYTFEGLADLADLPLIKDKIRKSLEKKISKKIVYPNRASLALSHKTDPLSVHTLPLTSMLRIRLGVVDLPSKGGIRRAFAQGDPDVYCKLKLGAFEKVTSVVKNSKSAAWEDWFEFPIEILKGHSLEVQVWDEDSLSRDDFMGQVVVALDEDIITEDGMSFDLEHHPFIKAKNDIQGKVNVELRCLPLVAGHVEEVATEGTLGVLSIFVYKLFGFEGESEESKVKLNIKVGEMLTKSKKLTEEDNFEVMEKFCFPLCSNWREQTLTITVMKNKSAVAEIVQEMEEILETAGMKNKYDLQGEEIESHVTARFDVKFIQM